MTNNERHNTKYVGGANTSPINQPKGANGARGYGCATGRGASRVLASRQRYEDVSGVHVQNTNGEYVYAHTDTSPKTKEKKKRKAGFWIGLVVAICALILAILLLVGMCTNTRGARQGTSGQLDGKTESEIQAELDRVVEEGMFNISIASVIEFENGHSEGDVRIENVPNNRYLMRVEIVRDDTGEVIYTTDFVEPNHHIQTDTLDVVLPKGTYNCTANFFAYDADTEDEVGQAAAKVVVSVLA